MKSNFRILLAAFALLAALSAASSASAADASVSAVLILGSNDGQGVDASLKDYAPQLQRVLSSFDTFKQKGQGSAKIALPGSGSISVGGGQKVDLKVEDAGSGRLRIAANWTENGRPLINTIIVTGRNQPTVLGGPSSGGGTLILLLVAR